jgi:hypothetical protein
MPSTTTTTITTTSTSTPTSTHTIEPEGIEAKKVAFNMAMEVWVHVDGDVLVDVDVDGFYFVPDRVPNRLQTKLVQFVKLEGLNKTTVRRQ